MFYLLANRPARSFQCGPAPVVSNGVLESFFNDTFPSLSGAGTTRAAIVENFEKAYSRQLDVPGLAKEQQDIGIEGNVVRVTSKVEATRKIKTAWRFPLEIDATRAARPNLKTVC